MLKSLGFKSNSTLVDKVRNAGLSATALGWFVSIGIAVSFLFEGSFIDAWFGARTVVERGLGAIAVTSLFALILIIYGTRLRNSTEESSMEYLRGNVKVLVYFSVASFAASILGWFPREFTFFLLLLFLVQINLADRALSKTKRLPVSDV